MSGRSFWQAVVNVSESAQKFHSVQAITSPYDDNPLYLTILVPCHNHGMTVIATVTGVIEAMTAVEKSYEIIIIDDGSTDGSLEKLREFVAQNGEYNLVLVANKKPAGPAENYLSAAFIGRGKYFRRVNPDNSESVKSMADIFKAVGDADIIVPYALPEMNETASQLQVGAVAQVLNILTRNRLNHYNSEAVHLRYNVLRWQPATRGPAFRVELLCRLLELGFTYKQVPCRMRERPFPATGRDWLSLIHVMVALIVRRAAHLFRPRT